MSDPNYYSEDDWDCDSEYDEYHYGMAEYRTVEQLIDGLKENRCFSALLPSYQQFTSLQAAAIADALAKNTRLVELIMPNSCCGGTGGKLIGDAIGMNKTLRRLVIGFSDEDLEQMAEGLGKSTSLISLQVLEVAEKGAAAIGKVLSHTSTLQELNLNDKEDEGVEFGDEGAVAIADGLLKNKSLKKLRLVRCGIEERGTACIAKSLESHPTMQKVNFAGNFIGEAGACAIARAIAKNRALAKIRIGAAVSEACDGYEGCYYCDDRFEWSGDTFASFDLAVRESIPRAAPLQIRGLSCNNSTEDDEVVAHLEKKWAHQQQIVAFGMGLDARLGKGSLVQGLDGDILKLIAKLGFADTLEYKGKTSLRRRWQEPAALPPGWERHHDRKSYRFFYCNVSLGKRQWNRPGIIRNVELLE
jgi:hypothetical protein